MANLFTISLRTHLLATGYNNARLNANLVKIPLLSCLRCYPFHSHVTFWLKEPKLRWYNKFSEGLHHFFPFEWLTTERKRCTVQWKFCRILWDLQSFEHCIVGFAFPFYLFFKDKPLFSLRGQKGQFSKIFRIPSIYHEVPNIKNVLYPTNSVLQVFLRGMVACEQFRITSQKQEQARISRTLGCTGFFRGILNPFWR